MLVTQQSADALFSYLDPEDFEQVRVGDTGKAMETLRETPYDLIVIDDTLTGDNTVPVVRELKRRMPLVPLVVASEDNNLEYQVRLVDAGIDDLLSPNETDEAGLRHFLLLLRQRRKNLGMARQNHDLSTITQLSRSLHGADHPMTLIVDAIDLLSSMMNLYGLIVALEEGDRIHLYAGSAGVNTNRRLYESVMDLHRFDPFRQSIDTEMVQIFKNLSDFPYYTPIPVLPDARSAIILPLNYRDHTFGSIGVLGTETNQVDHDNLVIYELFATHFASAYQNVRDYHSVDADVQSSRHLLRAWQRFTSLFQANDIAHALAELLTEIPNVAQTLVWLYDDDEQKSVTVVTQVPEVEDIFRSLHRDGIVNRFIEQFDKRMQPLHFRLGRDKQDPLGPLYRMMEGQQLVMVPITDSARLLGCAFVSVDNNQPISAENMNLLENLSNAAGRTLERNMLIDVMEEQTGRLEAILRSIHEGIFFVDHTDHIVFCNPQFTELTGINPSEVMGMRSQVLVDGLVQRSHTPVETQTALQGAITQAHTSGEDKDYPIVEFEVKDLKHSLFIEVLPIGPGYNNADTRWVGFLWSERQGGGGDMPNSERRQLLNNLIESVGVPFANLYSSIMTLSEQHGDFSYRERGHFIDQIEQQIEDVRQLWSNFLQVYNLEVSGVQLDRAEMDVLELVEHVVDSRAFSKYRRQIQIEAPPPRSKVDVDERFIERALSNVLENAVKFSPKESPILIQVKAQNDEVYINVQDQGIGIPANQIQNVFDPFYQAGNNPSGRAGAGLGLYITKELVEKHGGRVVVESRRGRGSTVSLILPALDGVTVTAEDRPAAAAQANQRRPGDVMVVEGRSSLSNSFYDELEKSGYGLVICKSEYEALRDLGMVRLDLIIVETDLHGGSGVDFARRLREDTEVPIMLLSEFDDENIRIQGLRSGADDFVNLPISPVEFVARIEAIAKRKSIRERTHQPLELDRLYIDFAQREVYLDNQPLYLTRIEYDLLQTLALNKGQVLTHKQLLDKVWGPEYQDETQYLWVNVSRLRKKLEPTPEHKRFIHTQPGIGYIFREP